MDKKTLFSNSINSIYAGFNLILLVAYAFMFMRAIGIIAEAIHPIPTLIVAAFLSFLTLEKRVTTVLALIGMILYASSWTVYGKFGACPGMVIWSIGVGIWFLAVGKSIASIYYLTPVKVPVK